jgi:serine/threonine protein kinase
MKTPQVPSKGKSGRYDPLKFVGAGGMQNVFLSTDTYLDRSVALKVPKDESSARRFERSAIVSARVNHANVAKTLDYFVESDRPYLIEEFVKGMDLGAILDQYILCLPPSTTASIVHALAKGLSASHNAGVVHRDLKPSNIMVVGGLEFAGIKITDFGIAKMAEDEIAEWADIGGGTSSGTVLGAVPYMSPESIQSFRTASKPSDVWALGAIAYELLSGRKPFGRGLTAVPAILEAVPPAVPPQINAAQFRTLGRQVYELILRCLQKDPLRRPLADELVQECELLCYSNDLYETGKVKHKIAANRGFLTSDLAADLFYHRNSIYGDSTVAVGDRLWFGRHPGLGNDRAFPIVKLRPMVKL